MLPDGTLIRPCGRACSKRPTKQGYLVVEIDGAQWKQHRVIFLLTRGYLPAKVDHKDQNKLNNRPDNLRDVENCIHNANRGKFKNNTSGIKGVTGRGRRWRVYLDSDGERYATTCTTKVAAVLQRLQWEYLYWGKV